MTSLYEYLRLYGDTDIYDATFHTATACTWAWPGLRPEADASEDEQDEWTVVYWMQSNIQMVRNPHGVKGVQGADLAGFCREHISLFSEFSVMCNNESYQVTGCDDDSLYNAVMTVEGLSCGNYTDRAYHYIAVRVRKYEPAVIA